MATTALYNAYLARSAGGAGGAVQQWTPHPCSADAGYCCAGQQNLVVLMYGDSLQLTAGININTDELVFAYSRVPSTHLIEQYSTVQPPQGSEPQSLPNLVHDIYMATIMIATY